MRCLILCAGNGTRLGYKTKPKVMAKVHGKPILEHLVNKLNKAGVYEIIVNVHKNYEPIFKYFGTRLLYLYEPMLLGEDGTERLLQDWLGDEYIVMNGDTLNTLDIKGFIKGSQEGFLNVHWFATASGKYAGTKYVHKNMQTIGPKGEKLSAVGYTYCEDFGDRYWDCGTKNKLAKCRREYGKY